MGDGGLAALIPRNPSYPAFCPAPVAGYRKHEFDAQAFRITLLSYWVR